MAAANACNDETRKEAGVIDLPGLFEAAAQELILSAEQGRILHRTRNIRDSGAPLEARFRTFLGPRLPTPFRVIQGYLFDAEAICTPQIDTLIIDGSESHELMTSSEGAAYVPFTSAHFIGEIKNSGDSSENHLKQISKIVQAIADMRRRQVERRTTSNGPIYHQPLSFLLLANTQNAKIDDFKLWFNENAIGPTYTILLDRGLVIASQSEVVHGPHLSFYDHRNFGPWFIFEPGTPGEYRVGRSVLWLYFSIVAHLNLVQGNTGAILDFTNDIERRYPLVKRTSLASTTDW